MKTNFNIDIASLKHVYGPEAVITKLGEELDSDGANEKFPRATMNNGKADFGEIETTKDSFYKVFHPANAGGARALQRLATAGEDATIVPLKITDVQWKGSKVNIPGETEIPRSRLDGSGLEAAGDALLKWQGGGSEIKLETVLRAIDSQEFIKHMGSSAAQDVKNKFKYATTESVRTPFEINAKADDTTITASYAPQPTLSTNPLWSLEIKIDTGIPGAVVGFTKVQNSAHPLDRILEKADAQGIATIKLDTAAKSPKYNISIHKPAGAELLQTIKLGNF